MIEKLNELEQRVVEVLERYRSVQQSLEEARAEGARLREQLGDREALAEENRALREKIRTLEGEILSLHDKEGEIRGRLTSILDRISLLESEIQESSEAPQ